MLADLTRVWILADMFVDVEIPIDLPDSLLVAADAVLDAGRRKTFFVVRVEGMFEPRAVETGRRLGDQIEILQGLMPGERVVTSGSFLLDPEQRPYTRNRYIPYVSLTQYIKPLHGSVEASYRFFQDSWGITANTLALTWHQKIGKHVVIAPEFRYYRQSAADFYAVSLPNYDTRPDYYSADYRLSEMQTFVGGVGIHVRLFDHVGLDASYKRYVMQGLDGVTSPTAYPSANVFSIGARVWF